MSCGVGALVGGCDAFDAARGAPTLAAVFAQPTAEDSTALAMDPYDPDKRYRGVTQLANADFGGADVYLRLYEDAASDEDSGVRQAGVRALGLHGTPEHVPLIAERLEDEDRLVRIEAARALQRLHDASAIRPLLTRLQMEVEDEAAVRAEAAHALGQYRRPQVLDGLIAALADPSLAVNHATVQSLETLTGQNFGLDQREWVAWTRGAEDPFRAGRVYAYPGFERDRKLYEYLPFVPEPPTEPAGAPVGLPRDGG